MFNTNTRLLAYSLYLLIIYTPGLFFLKLKKGNILLTSRTFPFHKLFSINTKSCKIIKAVYHIQIDMLLPFHTEHQFDFKYRLTHILISLSTLLFNMIEYIWVISLFLYLFQKHMKIFLSYMSSRLT